MRSLTSQIESLDISISSFAGTVLYVDGTDGNDANSGLAPDEAFATIGAGIAALAAGDALSVKTGTYDEDGLDLALDGVQLWADSGVIINNTTPGTCLTVSADYCTVIGLQVSQAGQVGYEVAGSFNRFENCGARGCSTGWNIAGQSNVFHECKAGNYTVYGWDIESTGSLLYDCLARTNGAAVVGFYLDGAENTWFYNCATNGNTTAGWQTSEDSINCMMKDCAQGSTDGDRIDAGYNNRWPGFEDQARREQHEHVYPPIAGEGVASAPVTVSNQVTDDSGAGPWDDQDYWGDVVRLVPISGITTPYYVHGLYIHATTAADLQGWEMLFTNYHFEASRNGGNVWDYQETVLTVDDASNIEVGDKVWITGTSHLDGEIVDVTDVTGNVVTIASETRSSGDTGLKYNYAGAEKMYVVHRADNPLLHGIEGDYSAATARAFERVSVTKPKQIEPNGAAIIRMVNGTDNSVSSFDCRLIWTD